MVGGGTADNAKRPMALGEGRDKCRRVGNKCKKHAKQSRANWEIRRRTECSGIHPRAA